MPTMVLNGAASNNIEMDNVDVGFQGHKTPHFDDNQQVVQVDEIAGDRGGKAMSRSDSDSDEGAGSPPKPGILGGILDANAYATKKTIAQGMLDVALLTANASQLKYLLQVGTQHEFYYLMMTLISISIILQIVVGIAMLIMAAYDLNKLKDFPKAARLNNWTTIASFLIVAINVFVSAFGVATWSDFPEWTPKRCENLENFHLKFNEHCDMLKMRINDTQTYY